MLLERALEIALCAHRGQRDKAGNPYILHPLWVMMRQYNEADRVCAVLHDVVEDTPVTLDDLRQSFPEGIVRTIDCLTRRPCEEYERYIGRVLTDRRACRIKLDDLAHNMDLNRIPGLSVRDLKRHDRYEWARSRILAELEREQALFLRLELKRLYVL